MATGDAIPENNESAVPITITQAADIVVTKQADVETPTVGDNVTYTVTVTNAGPSNATGVVLDDALPPGVLLVSAVGDGALACAPAGAGVHCEAPALEPGASATATLVVSLPDGLAPGDLTNTATGSSAIPDPDPTNNSASATVTAQVIADTAITKTVLTDPVVAGAPITFALDVVNRGPQTAPGVVIADSLPAGLTLVSATTETGTCELTRPEDVDVVGCNVGTLPVGATARRSITVTGGVAGQAFENAASVGSGALDELSDDNIAVAGFVVVTPTKEPPPGMATVGGTVWEDVDEDGIVGATESRIANAVDRDHKPGTQHHHRLDHRRRRHLPRDGRTGAVPRGVGPDLGSQSTHHRRRVHAHTRRRRPTARRQLRDRPR